MAKSVKTNITIGSAADNQQVYLAPSGTTNGSLRGARVTYIHIANPSPTLTRQVGVYRGTVGGALYIVPPYTTILPSATLTLHTSIELEPAEFLSQTASADLVTTVTAEEYIQGP